MYAAKYPDTPGRVCCWGWGLGAFLGGECGKAKYKVFYLPLKILKMYDMLKR
jgi:hypothetical protein